MNYNIFKESNKEVLTLIYNKYIIKDNENINYDEFCKFIFFHSLYY